MNVLKFLDFCSRHITMGNIMSWCCNAVNKRAIAETRAKRQARFDEVTERVSLQDAQLRDEILSLSLFELRDSLQNDKYNATKVLYAYAWKALKIQAELNCICEFLIESFDEAKNLDEQYQNSASKPPLYGIPFSVKNNFYLKGYDCTVGLSQFLGSPKTIECTLVTQLKNLGAVPFVSTNVPQTLLSFMCSNPIYGVTLNPYNKNRTPGGSSGGEACLLSSGGTPFALGSDIGGSVRIPAVFCGVQSLKPTQDRFLVENVSPGIPGRSRLGLSYGFFTKSVEEQCFLSELVWGSADYKRLILRSAASLSFRNELFAATRNGNRTLRIGYYSNDGFLKPVPGCARVVDETVARLRAQGFEMVRFHVPTPMFAASCAFREVLPDGGAYLSGLLKHDIVDEYMRQFAFLLKVPNCLRSLLGIAINSISPQASVMARSYVRTAEDVRIANNDLDNYNKQFAELWNELQIDALLCPAFAVPAVTHDQPSKLSACAFSTTLFNMLDYPAGIVRTGSVTNKDDADLVDEKIWTTGSNPVLKLMRTAARNSVGLPLAVQVVTRPFEEEVCLGIMHIVEDAWKDENSLAGTANGVMSTSSE